MSVQLIITTACQPKDVITQSVHIYARYFLFVSSLTIQTINFVSLIINRDGLLAEQDILLMQRVEIAMVRKIFHQAFVIHKHS